MTTLSPTSNLARLLDAATQSPDDADLWEVLADCLDESVGAAAELSWIASARRHQYRMANSRSRQLLVVRLDGIYG